MPSDTWTHTRSTPIRVDCAATQLSDASLARSFISNLSPISRVWYTVMRQWDKTNHPTKQMEPIRSSKCDSIKTLFGATDTTVAELRRKVVKLKSFTSIFLECLSLWCFGSEWCNRCLLISRNLEPSERKRRRLCREADLSRPLCLTLEPPR